MISLRLKGFIYYFMGKLRMALDNFSKLRSRQSLKLKGFFTSTQLCHQTTLNSYAHPPPLVLSPSPFLGDEIPELEAVKP